MVETYNDKVVKQFTVMTVIWGIVGMLVGVLIAAQLAWPWLNFDIAWLSYGRLRPLHTNAVIFAVGGSGLDSTRSLPVRRRCTEAKEGCGATRPRGFQDTLTRRVKESIGLNARKCEHIRRSDLDAPWRDGPLRGGQR